jgi:hypothetical protein
MGIMLVSEQMSFIHDGCLQVGTGTGTGTSGTWIPTTKGKERQGKA